MNILGIDVSHWNAHVITGLDLPKEGIDFLMWKATEGAHTVDPTWDPNCASSLGNPLLIAYHYMDDSSSDVQIGWIKQHVPSDIPVVLDLETAGTIQQAAEIMHGLILSGYSCPLFYYPHWVWMNQECPNVNTLPPLWASKFVAVAPQERLSPQALFGRTALSGWQGYGKQSVAMLQFTDSAYLSNGKGPVDVSAFSGDVPMLTSLLNHSRTVTPPLPVPPTYTVRAGDTLSSIALFTYGNAATWKVIAAANNLANPDRIFPGQKLVMPGWDGLNHNVTQTIMYSVKQGDSLSSIAAQFHVPVASLYQLNRITIGSNPNLIHPGLALRIPKMG